MKIPLLQEGFPIRTQTLKILRKCIAKPDHIELENFYVVKKREMTKLENICHTYGRDKEILLLIYKTGRSIAQ